MSLRGSCSLLGWESLADAFILFCVQVQVGQLEEQEADVHAAKGGSLDFFAVKEATTGRATVHGVVTCPFRDVWIYF